MRIAVIGAKGLPASQGGIERHCQELYSRLVAQGHQVDLYARSSYTRSLSCKTINGVRVISLPSSNLKGFDALICSFLGTLLTLIRFRQQPYDIVHFHALGPALFCGLPHVLGGARVVVTCHGLDWARAKWGKASRWLLRQGEQRARQCADALIVVSEDLQAYFQTTFDRATTYIPNAPAQYHASDPHFAFGRSLGLQPHQYVLFVGRLVPEKRPDILLQAFADLEHPKWKLVFVGGGSDSQSYVRLLKQTNLSEQVVFTGELIGDRLAEIVRGAGLLVIPSDLEGMPLVLLEAMNEGVPVLASDLEVHRRLLADGRGLLFTVGNAVSCQQQLHWAISHPQALMLMAEAASHHIQSLYNWDDITNQTLAVYEQVLATRKTNSVKREVSRV
jgi:glycosyltransferase involved in cell wall biosynthesis